MTPKRGEGAVKLRIKCGKCDCYLWRIYPNSGDNGERTALVCVDCDNEMGMRESATNRFGKFIIGKNAQFIALESSPSALIAAVEAQMKIAENHLAEATNDAKEEGWDSETVEYAGRQEGKVLAFKAVLKLLRAAPTGK